jgi:hypothetical protein
VRISVVYEFVRKISPESVKNGIDHLGSKETFEMIIENILELLEALKVDYTELDGPQCEFMFSLYVNGFISGYNEGTFSEISEDDIFS